MKRLTEKNVADQIRKLSGNVAAVARAFDVSRTAVYEYVKHRPSLQAVLIESRESMKDNVESRLYSDCLKDSPAYQTSRIFFLKTQAKDRGYVEKSEVEMSGPGGGPMVTEILIEHHDAEEEAIAPDGAAALGDRQR